MDDDDIYPLFYVVRNHQSDNKYHNNTFMRQIYEAYTNEYISLPNFLRGLGELNYARTRNGDYKLAIYPHIFKMWFRSKDELRIMRLKRLGLYEELEMIDEDI